MAECVWPLRLPQSSLAGCAEFSAASCPAGMREMWHAELLFGRIVGNQPGVSDGDWQGFVAAEIAPRFPAGFTVIDAAGEWRGENGSRVQEPSKVVVVVAPAGAETRARFDAIAAAYKLRFHQESVGIVLAPACISF
jgi:hypothetical protein